MMSASVHSAIMDVMGPYFDGLYRADPITLRSIFHDDLSYVNATRGEYVAKDLERYLDDIGSRIPPDQSGDRRNPKVVHIQKVSKHIIFVRATMSMMGRDYVDALILIDTDDGWRVIAKVFSHAPAGVD